MSVITLFSASQCHGDEVARRVADRAGLDLLEDAAVFAEAVASSSLPIEQLARAVHGPPSFFDRWKREREIGIAQVRAALARLLADHPAFVLHGFTGLLIPKRVTHALRVCLAARSDYRETQAEQALGIAAKEARDLVRKEDEARATWTRTIHRAGPWDKDLYDIFLPMETTAVDEAVDLVTMHAARPELQPTDASRRAVVDFGLASRVQVALAEAGHDVDVAADGDAVTITIEEYTRRLGHLEQELKTIAGSVPGVRTVATRLGPHYSRPDIYPKIDLPRKILLVDDEREFVRTLSERLQTRDLGAALAYDGEEALEILRAEAPDVMVLDLKMPGIDGLEVLRRVKHEHPRTEVIILTGHGTEREEALAIELGAFAYLQKPADIDVLAETMRAAYKRVQESRRVDASAAGGEA
ncbi:MAG: response regulator [Candidatus Eiseniibacteriota bacterium]|jgi:CheY-like chemotaxis protein